MHKISLSNGLSEKKISLSKQQAQLKMASASSVNVDDSTLKIKHYSTFGESICIGCWHCCHVLDSRGTWYVLVLTYSDKPCSRRKMLCCNLLERHCPTQDISLPSGGIEDCFTLLKLFFFDMKVFISHNLDRFNLNFVFVQSFLFYLGKRALQVP